MLYPLRDKINIFIYPAIFGVSRWLPFEGENKEIYQSGLVFAFPDAYQMGEKFSKSFIKIEFSCSIPWKEKIIRKNFIFFVLPCSTPWGDLSEISEAIHKIRVFVLYHLREKNIYGKGAVFDHPRCLPIEGRKYFFKRLNFRFFSWSTPWGRKFRSRHNFWPLQVGTSEGIFKTGVKKLASRCLLFEGRKFFWEWLPKRPLSVGISEEKIIPWNPHISNFLAGYSLGEQNFFENTY